MRGLLGFKGAESKKSHMGNEGFARVQGCGEQEESRGQ